jgi:hypothetical protein
MVLLHTPATGDSSMTSADQRHTLSQNYLRRGVSLDWRVHMITTDLTENWSEKDSEGPSLALLAPSTAPHSA